MFNKSIKELVLGDIHLGHHNNDTEFIISNLKKYFLINSKIFNTLDVIYIAGDLYERLLNADSEEYDLITSWLSELVLYCRKYDIKLRILEGTPDHDWKQARLFHKLITKLRVEIDFKYFEDIAIEYMEDLDQYVLYVPDKNNKPASERFKCIKELMKDLNITQIDKAIMHGNFRYQLPMINEFAHVEEDYLTIVKGYIHINHIHTSTVYSRILAGGSFDRMRHNEEEKKGGIYAENNNGEITFKFLENETARIFKTIDITSDSLDNDLVDVHEVLEKLPETSFVRIRVWPDDDLVKTVSSFRKIYNFKELKIETLKIDDMKNATLFKDPVIPTDISITKDNIVPLLTTEIGDKLTPKQLRLMALEISKII